MTDDLDTALGWAILWALDHWQAIVIAGLLLVALLWGAAIAVVLR